MDHPMAKVWPAVEQKLAEIPETINLPRDELLRIFKGVYFLGMADAMLGVATLELLTHEDKDSEALRAAYYAATSDMIQKSKSMRIDQILATIKAHEVK